MGQAGMKNNWKRNTRYMGVFAVLAAVFCMIVVLNINTGNVQISVPEILRILFLKKGTQVQMNIFWKIRLPRVLMAGILGGALALSGFLLQTFFSIPIAGPYVLGISSGAKMMVALAMIIFLKYYTLVSSYILIIAAFIGSMLSIGFILLLARKIRNMATLLVGGIMIGYICSAVTDFVVTFAEDSDIVNLHGWSQGSFSGMNWDNVALMAVVVFVALGLAFFFSKPMSAYQLGEAYARNMGVNISRFRVELILLSSVLSACVTAFAGPISFVGIAVPHLVKNLLGSAKPLYVLPGCCLGGAAFCLLCDLIARSLFAPTELSISSVTAVFGAPVVIWLLVRRQTEGGRE